MIKKVRRKFITIAMVVIIIVIISILGMINAMNYKYINDSIDERLDLLGKGGGRFPSDIVIEGEGGLTDDDAPLIIISPETPFDTRYFTAVIDKNGVCTRTDTGRIAAVSDDEAKEYARAAFELGEDDGYMGIYKYKTEKLGSDTMYIFLDCRRELYYVSMFMFSTITVGVLGALVVFIFIFIFSNMALRPIIESYEKQKRFITNAGHEIKTPITIIDASAEVIEMETGESEWTTGIKNQTKRLTALTEKLVLLSRMEESESKVHHEQFNLSDAVYETAEPYRAIATASNKSFTFTIGECIEACGNEQEIRQLVSLLLDNAMKYSNDGGSIKLELKLNGKAKEITVENTTDGIKKGKLDIFFERFYRADKSHNSKTGGFGIGLSVAQAIVNSHEGKISAYSPDGIRVIFSVTL